MRNYYAYTKKVANSMYLSKSFNSYNSYLNVIITNKNGNFQI